LTARGFPGRAPVLAGTLVRLEPLSMSHVPGLAEAAEEDRSSYGKAVGHTTLLHPRPWPGRDRLCAIEIGWTWPAASAQGTGLNVEAKGLLFGHAFETLRTAAEWPSVKTTMTNVLAEAAQP
jgi:N-acetyltransferase